MNKLCRTCKKTKPETEFSTASSGNQKHNFRARKYALKSQCKSCDAEYAREFRRKNTNYRGSGKIKKFPNRTLASAVSTRLIDAKSRSKRSGLDLNVDKQYLYALFNKQNGLCRYTGEALSLESKSFDSLSLDKIEPSKGYIKGNVQWVCWAVNRAKGDLPESMFLAMCRTITEKCND